MSRHNSLSGYYSAPIPVADGHDASQRGTSSASSSSTTTPTGNTPLIAITEEQFVEEYIRQWKSVVKPSQEEWFKHIKALSDRLLQLQEEIIREKLRQIFYGSPGTPVDLTLDVDSASRMSFILPQLV